MKLIFRILTAIVFLSSPVFAEEDVYQRIESKKAEGACKKLFEACKAAGFKDDGVHRYGGKDIEWNCMDKLGDGKKVKGVLVEKNLVEECFRYTDNELNEKIGILMDSMKQSTDRLTFRKKLCAYYCLKADRMPMIPNLPGK